MTTTDTAEIVLCESCDTPIRETGECACSD